MVGPRQIKNLRLKLRDELWKCFPRASAISIGHATNALMNMIVYESANYSIFEHADDCACWHCVLAVNAEVTQWLACRQVKEQAEQEHD